MQRRDVWVSEIEKRAWNWTKGDVGRREHISTKDSEAKRNNARKPNEKKKW